MRIEILQEMLESKRQEATNLFHIPILDIAVRTFFRLDRFADQVSASSYRQGIAALADTPSLKIAILGPYCSGIWKRQIWVPGLHYHSPDFSPDTSRTRLSSYVRGLIVANSMPRFGCPFGPSQPSQCFGTPLCSISKTTQ
jgi:hypothetical protein